MRDIRSRRSSLNRSSQIQNRNYVDRWIDRKTGGEIDKYKE